MKPSGYGPEKYHWDGPSLPSLLRQVCAVKWRRDKQPAPIQKFSGVTAKVRLRRALALVGKRRAK